MPARKHADPWVVSLRDMLKSQLGPAWRVMEQSGKVKIDVRFSDKTRSYGSLPILWKQKNSYEIQNAVLDVAQLVSTKKYSLKEAISNLYGSKKGAPKAIANTDATRLEEIWEAFINHKSRTTKESTIKGYRKSFKKLEPILCEVRDAESLLDLVTEKFDKGTRTAEITIRHLTQWLRWAVEKNYLVAERWSPPQKESNRIAELIGKSDEVVKRKTVPIYDDEIIGLIESIRKNRESKTADKYIYGIQLMSCYGLRPHEMEFVVVDDVGRVVVKEGKTGFREIYGIHPHWEKNWELLKKIKDRQPLPKKPAQGYGEGFRKWLIDQPYWLEIKKRRDNKENVLKTYSFRHGWAWRVHTDPLYSSKISTRLAASLMGHSHAIHMEKYGSWTPTGSIRKSLDNILGV